VLASVPIEQQSRFRGRKGTTTQNVLATINFNLKFTYVLAGWEGSTHDSRILNDALERPHGFQIPQGILFNLKKFLTHQPNTRNCFPENVFHSLTKHKKTS